MPSEFHLVPSMIVVFTVTVAFMMALRPLARCLNLIDRSGGQKSHVGEVKIIGGMAMLVGVFAGLALVQGPTTPVSTLLVASFLILAGGVLDDKYHVVAGVRL